MRSLVDFLSTRKDLRPLQDNIERIFLRGGHTDYYRAHGDKLESTLGYSTKRKNSKFAIEQVKLLTRPEIWTSVLDAPMPTDAITNIMLIHSKIVVLEMK
jgi:hypothetical protein